MPEMDAAIANRLFEATVTLPVNAPAIIMKKQLITAVLSILPAFIAAPAECVERATVAPSGFYGGLALREQGVDAGRRMALGVPASALSRFSASVVDESVSRSLLYGGYRWRNEVVVEASFNAADPYALKPADNAPVRRGVGLVPASGSLAFSDLQARSWNVDLFTSWNFYRSLALYGRLGYAQTDLAPTLTSSLAATDARRVRDGMNYGVGVRYDMTSALGLRLEYGRFGRFAGEIGSTPLESDQVTFGLQFRF